MKTFFALLTSALMLSSLSACGSTPAFLPVATQVQAQASARQVYHVVPDSKAGLWHVKLQRNPEPVASFRTKEQAVSAGRAIARAAGLGQLIIHKQNGQIETEHTYGNDPASSAG
jgi:hypothetical protein